VQFGDGTFVRWYVPYPPVPARHGGQIRVANLLRGVLDTGATVEFVFPGSTNKETIDGSVFLGYSARVREGWSGKIRCALSPNPDYSWMSLPRDGRALVYGGRRPDVVILSQPHQWPLARKSLHSSIPLVVDAQNVESDLYRQFADAATRLVLRSRMKLELAKSRRLEAHLFRSASEVVAVSEGDALMFRQMGARSVDVVANGVDLDYFSVQDHRDVSKCRLIMTGTLGYLPNVDAAHWLVSEILPEVREHMPHASVTLVGGAPALSVSALDNTPLGVRVVPDVPDVRPYIAAADIFVVPLRIGGGTPLKVAEALACGIPTVCTSRVARSLGIDDGSVAIGDTAEEMALAVRAIVADESQRSSMIESGLRLVRSRFDWHSLSHAFVRRLECTLADARGR
jgi:glycosyltransferase involved in cell wall biosynthesis